MIIKKMFFKNYKNLKNLEMSFEGGIVNLDEVFNNSNVKMWKSDFLNGVKFVFNIFCEDNDFAKLLSDELKQELLGEELSQTEVKVVAEFSENQHNYVLEKNVTYFLEDDSLKFNVGLVLNGEEMKINEHCDFCAQFYNHAFAFVSFLKKKTYGENLSRELWIDRFIPLLHFVDVDKEREQINKVMKHFKIAKKQLYLKLDENNVPQWYKPKGGLYLNGDYSEMENVLRFAYYYLTLNKFLSEKFNRNLPIFVEDIFDYLDLQTQKEFKKTLQTQFANQIIGDFKHF